MPKRFGLCCALLALSTSALAESRGPAARLEIHSVGPRRVGGVPAGAGRRAGIPLQGTSGRDGGGGSASRHSAVSRHSRERPVRRHGVHLRPPLRPASLSGQRTDPRSRRARRAYRGSAAGRSKVPRPGTLHGSFGIQTAERQQDGKSPSAGERALAAAADRRARRAPGAGAPGAIAGVAVSFVTPQRSLRTLPPRRKRPRRRRRRRRRQRQMRPRSLPMLPPRRKRLRRRLRGRQHKLRPRSLPILSSRRKWLRRRRGHQHPRRT